MRTPTFSIEVITLPVSNVERALRFYVDQVGFYNTLCSALVWAFGQALQPGFDDEVRAAWTAVIRAVNEQMKIGAAAVSSS